MRVKPTGYGNHTQPLRNRLIGWAIIAAVYGLLAWWIIEGVTR